MRQRRLRRDEYPEQAAPEAPYGHALVRRRHQFGGHRGQHAGLRMGARGGEDQRADRCDRGRVSHTVRRRDHQEPEEQSGRAAAADGTWHGQTHVMGRTGFGRGRREKPTAGNGERSFVLVSLE